MGNICNCFRFGKELSSETKQKQRLETLQMLNEITKKQIVKSISIPMQSMTKDEMEVFDVPNNMFISKEAVMAYKGYEIQERIGEGSNGTYVYKAIHLERQYGIACKVIGIPMFSEKGRNVMIRNPQKMREIKGELYIMQRINHSHITKLIEYFIVNSKIYIFMQLAPNGDLLSHANKFGPFTEQRCKIWFAQVLSAVYCMHNKGMAHRDLKLGNIVLDAQNECLVSDFGLSRIVYRKNSGGIMESNTFCGTPPYMSPELIEAKPYNAFKADIWALGVILYVLFNNLFPFNWKKKRKALKKAKSRKLRHSGLNRNKPSKDMENILRKMLEPEPTVRINTSALTKHKWIKNEFCKVLAEEEKYAKLCSEY